MLIDNRGEARDRLIVALDLPTAGEAISLMDELQGLVSFYKVGYQLFLAAGMEFVRTVMGRGARVFLDLKMDDVEETITSALREITRNGVHLLTLQGSRATAQAALAGRGQSAFPKILSVTLLSSLGEQDLIDLQILGKEGKFRTLIEYVLWRAGQAADSGCDGVIASGNTVAAVRSRIGDRAVIVSPGIRPAGSASDEHKRSATPREAIAAGADYLVVGRPIRNAPDRRAAARAIIEEIEEALSARV
jgi:orotidine-5'-phosphate decarboxylase